MKTIITTAALFLALILPFEISLGQSAETVQIGSQTWMTENLNVDRFRNGDPIPQAKTLEEWEEATRNENPVWSYYENDPANGSKYGKLYNWYAVNDTRGLAPEGWHVPSRIEWDILLQYLDLDQSSSNDLKERLWLNNGYRGGYVGWSLFNYKFEDKGSLGYWWSTSEPNSENFYRYTLGQNRPGGASSRHGYSVRVIRDYTKEEYSRQEGVVQTDSGLLYRVIEEGEGLKLLFGQIDKRQPTENDNILFFYTGFLTNGTIFDSSYSRDGAVVVPLNALIPGLVEGIQQMRMGAKYEFYIPAELAYGDNVRANGPIAPGSDLLFYVELLRIE